MILGASYGSYMITYILNIVLAKQVSDLHILDKTEYSESPDVDRVQL